MDATSSIPSAPLLGLERMPDRRAVPDTAAKAFEGMFVSLLLKQMRQTLDGNSMFAGDTSDVLGGLFDHYLGDHIAKSGGMGIGAMIRKQMERGTERTRPT